MPTITIGDNTGQTAGTEDTYLKMNAPTTNFSSSVDLEVHTWDATDHGVALVRFDLSSITPPVTVSAVEVGLFLNSASGGVQTFSIFRTLRAWVEAQATWNQYSTGNNWQTAGAAGALDISASLQDLSMGGTINQYYTWTAAALNAVFENWINGSVVNNGLAWKHTAVDLNSNTFRTFASSRNVDGERPYVTITYAAAGGATPVPPDLIGGLSHLTGGMQHD